MWTYDIYFFVCDILYVLCLIYDQYNCKYWIYVYLYVVWHWLIKNWIELNVQYNRKFNGPNTCLEAKWPPHTHFFLLVCFLKACASYFPVLPWSLPPLFDPLGKLPPNYWSNSNACPHFQVHFRSLPLLSSPLLKLPFTVRSILTPLALKFDQMSGESYDPWIK